MSVCCIAMLAAGILVTAQGLPCQARASFTDSAVVVRTFSH